MGIDEELSEAVLRSLGGERTNLPLFDINRVCLHADGRSFLNTKSRVDEIINDMSDISKNINWNDYLWEKATDGEKENAIDKFKNLCINDIINMYPLNCARKFVENEIRSRHPELNDAAISAIGNAFAYWWK